MADAHLTRDSQITTVILAGGEGRRMGGGKALRKLQGRPMIEWVVGKIKQQGGRILISAYQGEQELAYLDFPVLPDRIPGQAGPLAGLHAAMHAADTEWVACVPCDTPYLPDDLLMRLYEAVGNADAAVAVVEGRWQPTIAICRRSLLPRLEAFLQNGGRKAGEWLKTVNACEVLFDEPEHFRNFNTLEELHAANDKN